MMNDCLSTLCKSEDSTDSQDAGIEGQYMCHFYYAEKDAGDGNYDDNDVQQVPAKHTQDVRDLKCNKKDADE